MPKETRIEVQNNIQRYGDEYAVVGSVPLTIYEGAEHLRGYQQILEDILINRKIAEAIFCLLYTSGLILTMMWVTQNLSIIHLMTGGGPGRATEILSTYIYKLNFRFYKESEASAASIIYLLFILSISLAYLSAFKRVWRGEQ